MQRPLMETTLKSLADRSAVVTIIGLGYVGLPLALLFARAGFRVYGVDSSEERVQILKTGKSPIMDVDSAEICERVADGSFMPTTDYRVIRDSTAMIICVPTPLRKTKDPDMSFILNCLDRSQEHLHAGQIIVLESTTYPGTTEELVFEKISRTGLKIDVDFYLAFSPERVDPGNKTFSTETIVKVVGGATKDSSLVAAKLYSSGISHVHIVSSARVAEMAKLLENTYRAVNIALINEMALMANRMNIDIWEVIEAAATKPFGFERFDPGPGIGGHCIPLDPHYLAWKARLVGFHPRFIELADQINGSMPKYVLDRLIEDLNGVGKALRNCEILILGVAYKRDVNDARESPAGAIIDLLLERGAHVSFMDPYISDFVTEAGIKLHRVGPGEACPSAYDAAIVVTNHSVFDWDAILSWPVDLILDTRNSFGTRHPKVRLL